MKERFENWLKDVHFQDYDFNIHMDGERPYLQIGFWAYDNAAPIGEQDAPIYQTSRKWFLSGHMTKSEVIQTAFKAVMTAEEHEIREQFTYKGQPIFGPHFDVDVLVNVCEREVLDAR